MTNEQHNRYISWVFVGHAIFQMLLIVFMMAMMGLFLSMPMDGRPGGPPPPFPPQLFAFMFVFMFVFQMIFVIPSLVAAYALRKRKSWARMAAIVAGVMSAMNVPIGTAACVYSLWFFLGDNWKEIYPETAEKKGGVVQLNHDRETRWAGRHVDEKGEIKFHPIEPPDWR